MKKKKILIVDDEPNILFVISQAFQDEYCVFTAAGGEKALELLRAEKPDFVFLDIKMPGLSGIEVLARIKTTGAAPVVWMLTGNDELDTAMETLRAGASGYLTKPFDLAQIRMVVTATFDTQKQKESHDSSGDKPWRVKKDEE
jgi:DNA-binding response OmpR family regulator